MKKLLKKLLILTVCATMVITAMPLTGTVFKELLSFKALAYNDFIWNEYEDDDYFEYGEYECRIEEEGKISIIKYKGGAAEVVVPSEINGYTVAYIGEYAFSPMAETESGDEVIKYPDCNNLVSVTIPSTIIEIGFSAFYNCQNLENVTFSEGLEYIGVRVFDNCIKLNTIDLPSTLREIDTAAFYQTAIEELVIKDKPNNYFMLKNKCFKGSSIKRVIIKADVTVGSSPFENSSVEEIIFEGKVRGFPSTAISKENNPVKRIIFKADFPSGTIENLTTTSGYYYHKNSKDGSIRFDTISYNSDYAEIFTLEGFGEYAINENSEAVILKYTGKSSQITVPEVIDGHTVVEISEYAFYKYSTVNIKKIVIPSSVKKIGAYAFYYNRYLEEAEFTGAVEFSYAAFKDCWQLETIKTSDSIKIVEPYAFYNCGFKEISLRNVEEIGEKAFMKSVWLRTVTLPDYLTDIGEYAFSETDITTIKIPEGIKVIRERTFSNCRSLSTIILPTTIEEIEPYAFVNCDNPTIENTEYITKLNSYSFYGSKISSFDFNPEIKEIPAYCFYGAEFNELVVPPTIEKVGKYAYATACTPTTSDINHIVISEGVKEIGEHSFEDNGQYTLTLPSTLEEIPIRAFKGATISNLVIPEGVKYIRDGAFALLKAETLTIPESLKSGYDAFFNANVNTLYFNAINCSSLEVPYILNLYIGDKVEVISAGLCTNSRFKEIVIPEGVKTIGASAFEGNSKLTSITLPTSLKTIGQYAFQQCTSLKEFTITEGITTFYSDAFYRCTALETIYLNSPNCDFKKLTKDADGIYQSPFYYNNRNTLKKIVIGDNVKTVPAYLLSCMPNEVECVMPDTVENIGDYAFYSCPKLTEFNAPYNLKNIGYYAFAKSGLVTFNGNENLESIGKGCFEGCKNLVNINLGGEPKVIVASVSEDENTEAVNPVSNLMLIGANAFANCTSLTEIIIPDSVKDIGEKAFYGDKALVSVKMSDNVIFIPDECFNGCAALETFIWNAESKLIGRLAFSKCAKLADFDFVNIEKLYDNSFLNSGVADVQLGEAKDDEVAKLTVVESQSFMDCDSLTSVGVGGNVTTIKTQAFANCENLETVYIADSVTEIAADAFDGCENMMIYCSVDSYAHTYAQTQGLSVSTLVIAPIPNQTYTGFEIKPEISVSASGSKLAENVDFGVTYANNINVGNADVNVKGLGDFRMFASKAKFTIVTKNISAVTVSPVADQPYTGSAVTPEITVTDGIKVLREGTDYTVTYANNINEGSATVTITGKGNYSGTTTTNFQISKEAEEPVEPSFFEKVFSAVISFFARIIAFLVSIFM